MTLMSKNREHYGRNCYAAQRADSPRGAFQQSTSHDTISEKFFGLLWSRYTHEHLKVKRGRRKYDFNLKENESSIIHGNQNEESLVLGSFN